MPIYEYECGHCLSTLEEIQRFDDPPLRKCKVCGRKTLKKVFGVPALKFNGPGFYVNDYGRSSQGTSSKSEGE